MRKKLLFSFCIICICFALVKFESHKIKSVQIIFFDDNNFGQTDTLFLNNIDTVNRVKNLFKMRRKTQAKFPRKYQITFLGKRKNEVYYGNGNYVRSNKKTYLLPKGEELNLFELLLSNRMLKKEIHMP